jgi:hypothetical protein
VTYRLTLVHTSTHDVVDVVCLCREATNEVVTDANVGVVRLPVVGWFDGGEGVAWPAVVVAGTLTRVELSDEVVDRRRRLLVGRNERLSTLELTVMHRNIHGLLDELS